MLRVEAERGYCYLSAIGTQQGQSAWWIPSALDEKVHDIAVLVPGMPELVPFPVNGDQDFVDVSGIA